ncbi:hypothetical protein CVS40_9879 [Lucilia cuprina]|nr:hypothetical protein CVS40_9879 [Lucilia cuprina]
MKSKPEFDKREVCPASKVKTAVRHSPTAGSTYRNDTKFFGQGLSTSATHFYQRSNIFRHCCSVSYWSVPESETFVAPCCQHQRQNSLASSTSSLSSSYITPPPSPPQSQQPQQKHFQQQQQPSPLTPSIAVQRPGEKSRIQEEFKVQMGLNIDKPLPSCGSTNDGNTARKFFRDFEITSKITGIDKELLRRVNTILMALNSKHKINGN